VRRDSVGRKPDELLGVRNEIEAALGRRAGPHLLTDAKAARGYRLLEAANFLLVAARAAERGELGTVRARLEGVAKSVERTLKELEK
jgi:hypothetical protein